MKAGGIILKSCAKILPLSIKIIANRIILQPNWNVLGHYLCYNG
jgi:hypothetical protein